MDLGKGEQIKHNGSIFTAFSVPTNNHNIIDDAYMKLRLQYPGAKHIVCAFIILGMPRFQCEDFCDDGDTGMGRHLLWLLQQNEISNLAMFVVRQQTGPKLGPMRFQLMDKAAAKALQSQPYNKFINQNQAIVFDTEDFKKTSYDVRRGKQKNNRGGRGGGSKYVNKKSLDKGAGFNFPFATPLMVRGASSDGEWNPNYDRNKRRCQDSIDDWNVVPSNKEADRHINDDLGGSWPSLAQAASASPK